MPPSRRAPQRPALAPEVKAAVDDIVNGTTVDSTAEWLQREYYRMMQREAELMQRMRELESKLGTAAAAAGRNGQDVSLQTGEGEQHRALQPEGHGELMHQDSD